MPGVDITSVGLVAAGFLKGRSASKDDISPEKDAYQITPLNVETGILSTCNDWLSRLTAQVMLGADRTADVNGQIDEVLNWLAVRGVRIDYPADVRAHLLRYSDLLIVIPTVWKKAVALLSPATQFSIALYRDPEISDEYLTLYARQEKYEESILDLIHAINLECEDMLSSFSGWFLTTTDFRPPK